VPLVVGIGGQYDRLAPRSHELGRLICEKIKQFTT
jgi:hypothetical protein